MNPRLEPRRETAVDERDNGTLLLNSDPVRLVEQRQSSCAGVLGKGAVNQGIELRRRPTLDIAGATAVEQRVEEVLGVRIPGNPHLKRTMAKLVASGHLLNVNLNGFDLQVEDLAPGIELS